jgi:hypothetical protein
MAEKTTSMHIADLIGCEGFRKGLEQPVTPVKPSDEPHGLYSAMDKLYGKITPWATATDFRHGQKG